jgi:O-antigen/teichoic acid export membrane protein
MYSNPDNPVHGQIFRQNVLWQIADRVWQFGLSFTVGVLVARQLGPSAYGQLVYAAGVLAMYAGLASLGLDSIVVRDLVRYPGQEAEILTTAGMLRLAGSVLQIVLALLTAWSSGSVLIVALLCGGTLFQSAAVFDFYLQARNNVRLSSRARILIFTGAALLRLYGIYRQESVYYYALIMSVEQIGLALLLAHLAWNSRAVVVRFNRLLAERMVRESWPMLLTGVAVAVHLKVDQVILGRLYDAATVGCYGVAVRLAEAMHVLPMAMIVSYFPIMIADRFKYDVEYAWRWQRYYDALVWSGIIGSAALSLLAPVLIRTLYGARFLAGGAVLQIYGWSVLPACITMAISRWYIAEGRTIRLMITNAVPAVINIALNMVLVPRWGMKGAAWATVISYGVAAGPMHALWQESRSHYILILRAFRPWQVLRRWREIFGPVR